MPENTPVLQLTAGAAFFLTGLSKGGLGGAIGFLITPLLALVMPLQTAVGLMLPILILADVFAIWAFWRRWEAYHLSGLLVGGVVGVTLAMFTMVKISPDGLKKGLAVLVLLFLAYRLLENRLLAHLSYTPHRWHGLLAGSTAGFASTLAHAGGPPVAVYLLLQRMQPDAYLATNVLFFAILNWIKVPFYYGAGIFNFELQMRLLPLALLTPVGVFVGRAMVQRVDRVAFERVVMGLLFLSSLLLLVG